MTATDSVVRLADLNEGEQFVVHVARTWRNTSQQSGSCCAYLSHLFTAARLASALPAFLNLQVALSLDPQRTITYEKRDARIVGPGELALLQALWHWQHDEDPLRAVWFIPVRATRRVASDAGRAFARAMAAAGLVMPHRATYATTPGSLMTNASHAQALRAH